MLLQALFLETLVCLPEIHKHTHHVHTHTHTHLQLGSSHSSDDEEEKQLTKLSSTNANFDEEDPTESSSRTDLVHSGDGQNGSGNGEVLGSVCVEPTMPHGQCKDTLASSPAAILHPSEVAKGSKSEVTGRILWVMYCNV